MPRLETFHLNQGGLYCSIASFLSSSVLKVNTKVTRLVYPSNSCNSLTSFSVVSYPYLEKIEVGDDSFMRVSKVVVENDDSLKEIVIGANSFTNHKYSHGEDSSRTFTLKNCPRLTALSMGRFSLSDFGSFSISSREVRV